MDEEKILDYIAELCKGCKFSFVEGRGGPVCSLPANALDTSPENQCLLVKKLLEEKAI